MTYTGETPNARYGRIVLGSYTAFNGLMLVGVSVGAWILNSRAHSHGIAPNTTLGFRSEHTLTSLHGWYVAQRVGFQFAAISATVITVAVLATVAVAFLRRLNAMWILIVPVVGGIALGGCVMIAGQRADHAAISVETPQPPERSLGGPSGHTCFQVRRRTTSRTASSETRNMAANRA